MLSWFKRHIILWIFAVVAYTLLLVHGDYLFAIQEESLFMTGQTFMHEIVNERGGWLGWAGCALTQFFYYPWLGSAILTGMWIAVYFCIVEATGWDGWKRTLAVVPQCIMLYLLLCLGYWIYYIKASGFAFVPTLILLLAAMGSLLCTKALGWFRRRENHWVAYVFFAVFVIAANPSPRFYSVTLPDSRLYSEIRMYRAIDECRWQDVIEEHGKVKEPTNLMVMYKNIALMHSGRLQEMFKTNNSGSMPESVTSLLPHDTLRLSVSRLGAPMIYYQYGQLNFAYRWALGNAIKYGQSVSTLKMLTRCAILNQEFDLAERYIMQLKTTLFHKDWAVAREALMSSITRLTQTEEFKNIAPMMVDEGNVLDVDNGMCELWLLSHFADLVHPANPKLEEVIITTSLWMKDAYAFDIHFYNYVNAHPNDAVPSLYQEAAILLCTREDSPVTLDNFPFDQIIADRYNRFVNDYNQLSAMQLNDEEMGRRLRPVYGDTYWWYYYFYTNFKLY